MTFSALVGKLDHCSPNRGFFRSVILVALIFLISPKAHSDQQSDAGYYLRMKNDDFTQIMLPKEKYLLGVVTTVQEELDARRREGQSLKQFGLENLILPQDKLVNQYNEELLHVESLLKTIEDLERLARKKSNFAILEALSGVKLQMRQALDRTFQIPDESIEETESTEQPSESVVSELNPDDQKLQPTQLEFGSRENNLFEQWKYNRLLDYKIRITKYQILRKRLLEHATSVQKKRMFQRELKYALSSYNANDFKVCRYLLTDLINQYKNQYVIDDIYYYAAESSYGLNFFDEALEAYRALINSYPSSDFTAKALIKILYIYSIYDDIQKQSEVYQQLVSYHSQIDSETWGTVSYLFGYSQFRAGQYQQALETLSRVTSVSTYYFPALYLSAACYSNLGNDAGAILIYQRLISQAGTNQNPILDQIRNNALLKMGLIYYEQGDTPKARFYFDLLDNSQSNELALLGKAWIAYQDNRPVEALKNAETLLKQNMVSSYMYEARVLAASSKQLLGKREEALDDLKSIFESGNLIREVEKSSDYELQAEFDNEQQSLIKEAEKLQQFMGALNKSAAPTGTRAGKNLEKEIARLDTLEIKARDKNNLASLSEIRQLRGQMIEAVQSPSSYGQITAFNEKDPLIQQLGMSEYLNYLFRSLLLETLSEKQKAKLDIIQANAFLKDATQQNKFKIVLQTEIRIEELQDYYNYLNRNEIWFKENVPQEMQVEVGQWANFSGYGISNINFSRIKEIEQKKIRVSRLLASAERSLTKKREQLELRIQNLLGDVERIEEQIREESIKREDQARESMFKRGYFDKRVRESTL